MRQVSLSPARVQVREGTDAWLRRFRISYQVISVDQRGDASGSRECLLVHGTEASTNALNYCEGPIKCVELGAEVFK